MDYVIGEERAPQAGAWRRKDADDLAEVQRISERTRESIQGMIQALLRERRSVFAG